MKPPYVSGHVRVWKGTLLSIAGVASISAAPAWADDIDWGNVNGGSFHVGTNWIGGILPGAADSVYFRRTRNANEQAAYTLTFSSSPSNVELVVERDRVTLDLNGNAYSLTDPITAMRVGTSTTGTGRLILTDGIVATAPDSQVKVGAALNAPGSLTISTGAQLFGPYLLIGVSGPGTLVVQNGADIVGGPMFVGSHLTAVAPGTATVTGAGSAVVVEALSVGGIAAGTVNINAGARVESTMGKLGASNAAIGTVNVDGAGSRWSSSDEVLVGYDGRGALNITNGGRVECDRTTTGFLPDSSGTLNVQSNGVLVAQDRCVVGNQGAGTMHVGGGGQVECAFGDIGIIASGTATVDGAGSRWTCSADLSVGAGTNSGTLAITGGGEVISARGAVATYFGAGSVSVTGTGSRWAMTGDLAVGGSVSDLRDGGPGSVAIEPGGTVTAQRVFLYPEGTVELRGGTLDVMRITSVLAPGGELSLLSGVLHAETVEFPVQNQGATLSPGRSIGFTTIAGSYAQQTAATLEIQIRGVQFDLVVVAGTASLDGTLSLRLLDGLVPSPTQRFVVLRANAITGAFANVANGSRLAVAGGGSFVVNYGEGSPFDPTDVVLSGFSACRADFNGDGFVNSQDFFDFLNAFFALQPAADINHDAFINSQDFFDFLAALFAGC